MIINFVPKISGLEIDFEMNLLRLEPFLGIICDSEKIRPSKGLFVLVQHSKLFINCYFPDNQNRPSYDLKS